MAKLSRQEVYEFLRTIPRGNVVTYGMIGEHLGNRAYARAVGSILHENPDGVKYPCYKVVSSSGRLSVHYAFGGIEAQRMLLEADGIEVREGKVDLARYKWQT